MWKEELVVTVTTALILSAMPDEIIVWGTLFSV